MGRARFPLPHRFFFICAPRSFRLRIWAVRGSVGAGWGRTLRRDQPQPLGAVRQSLSLNSVHFVAGCIEGRHFLRLQPPLRYAWNPSGADSVGRCGHFVLMPRRYSEGPDDAEIRLEPLVRAARADPLYYRPYIEYFLHYSTSPQGASLPALCGLNR